MHRNATHVCAASALTAMLASSSGLARQIDCPVDTSPAPYSSYYFFHEATVWTGNPSSGNTPQSSGNTAAAATIWYSFGQDGASWGAGIPTGNNTGTNDIHSALESLAGSAPAIDLAKEYFRQALASWRKHSGLMFEEILEQNDPEVDQDTDPERRDDVGDIRFGGYEGTTGAINPAGAAYANYPVGGGDIILNTESFAATYGDTSGEFRRLLNTVAHEVGHALGLYHAQPTNRTKLMESASLALGLVGPQIDEIRIAQRNYGDRFARDGDTLTPNSSSGDAHNFGTVTTTAPVYERLLSPLGTTFDWFKFTIASTTDVEIKAIATGGAYTVAVNNDSTYGSTAPQYIVRPVIAQAAGNLAMYLYDNSLDPVSSSTTPRGEGPTISAPSLAAGTYYIKITDQDGGLFTTNGYFAQNQGIQLYDLSIAVDGSGPTLPVAIAGVHKRIPNNTTAYFIGDMNSYTTAPGATIVQYDWDLDGNAGNGFEVEDDPRPSRGYALDIAEPELFTIRLRVTDSNGKQGIDTIKMYVMP